MKIAIMAVITVAVIALAAFLIVGNYNRAGGPDRSAFDANAQALSNGLIPKDRRLLPEAESRAVRLFDSACAFCHDLPDPASHDAVEWEAVIDRMEPLMAELKLRGIALPWDPPARKEVIAYLARHAFQGMNPADLPNTPEKGAKLFREACASCHTLPDPAMHTAEVWEYVVAKMQNFQKEAGLDPLTGEESAALLDYLKPLAR